MSSTKGKAVQQGEATADSARKTDIGLVAALSIGVGGAQLKLPLKAIVVRTNDPIAVPQCTVPRHSGVWLAMPPTE